jgi:hypothetical protein
MERSSSSSAERFKKQRITSGTTIIKSKNQKRKKNIETDGVRYRNGEEALRD